MLIARRMHVACLRFSFLLPIEILHVLNSHFFFSRPPEFYTRRIYRKMCCELLTRMLEQKSAFLLNKLTSFSLSSIPQLLLFYVFSLPFSRKQLVFERSSTVGRELIITIRGESWS